jgi:Ser/Thr protein kinase RdoA (MazF antagonist)
LLAQLHNVYRKINIPDFKNSPDEFSLLDRFRKNLINTDQIPEGRFKQIIVDNRSVILDKMQEINEKLMEKEYKNFPRYPTHYDLNFTNVLWKDDEIVSILDFDWAQYSTLEFDFCQACKLTGGLFSINGHSNEFLGERLKLALQTYNKHAEVPFEDPKILVLLLDISSLFLLNWSIEFFKDDPKKEDYFIHFFQTGFDRIFQKNKSELLIF